MHSRAVLLLIFAGACAAPPAVPEARWWKGNLHTHSLWTDGGDFPEMIAAWYRDHGYNFLAVTEHDMLQEGERWVDINAADAGWPPRNASTRAALPGYRERFGTTWVQERHEGNRDLVRLRGLSEYRHLFEARDSFLFIMSEEITDKGGAHVNAFNLDVAIAPQGGTSTAERTRRNLAAVAARRRESSRNIIAIVNHPNFVWSLKPQEIADMADARLFEVYNGHRTVNNAGDSVHPGTEAMWDMILTQRHGQGGSPIYGVATDDAHEYRSYGDTVAMPGRAWVMVRAADLTVDNILNALGRGDFYASTGVTLRRVDRTERGISIAVQAQPNVSYRTLFIGTRRNSDKVGEELAEVTGDVAEYVFRGDERYVRATVISSQPHIDPISNLTLGRQMAWVQPVMR
jgi:hypothetical protein